MLVFGIVDIRIFFNVKYFVIFFGVKVCKVALVFMNCVNYIFKFYVYCKIIFFDRVNEVSLVEVYCFLAEN